MIVKNNIVDQINVLELGQIQVRTITKIMEDGVEISRTYIRHVLAPGDDLSGEDSRVVAVANVVWTPEVIAAYQAAIAE